MFFKFKYHSSWIFSAGCHGEVDIGGQLLVSVAMVNGENKYVNPATKNHEMSAKNSLKRSSNQQIIFTNVSNKQLF